MSSPNCPYFEECNAPLCPIDAQSLAHGSWFPDEETCKRREFAADWIGRQRKVARSTGGDPDRGCFTVEMLSRNFRISGGLRGLDPDRGPITAQRSEAWLSEHPALRELTGTERQALASKFRARVQEKSARSRARNQKEPRETGRETGSETSDVKVYGNPSERLATAHQRTTEAST